MGPDDRDSDGDGEGEGEGVHEYLLSVPQPVWQEFSGNVPKSRTYSEVIVELIRAYNREHRTGTEENANEQ